MFTRVLVTVTLVVCAIDASSAFAISPESVALQTAAIGSKLSDIRNTAAEVTQAVGETVQENVNVAVDTVNQASSAVTSTLNNAYVTGQNAVQGVVTQTQNAVQGVVTQTQNAVQGVVTQTQNAVSGAVSATQEVVGSAVQTASNALQTASDVVLTPFRLVGDHVSDKFVLISDKLYQIVNPSYQEIVYVPVSPSTYASPGIVVPANHQLTYTEVVQPSYTYKSGGVDEFLEANSEKVESIVVPDTPKGDKPLLPTFENGASLPHFEYPDVILPTEPIYEVNPKTGLIQFNHPAYTSLSQKASSPILPYDERNIDITTSLVRNKRIINEDFKQFFR